MLVSAREAMKAARFCVLSILCSLLTTLATELSGSSKNGCPYRESIMKRVWNGPLFGRLPKSGRSYLIERGWEYLEQDPGEIDFPLSFIWPSKSGPQFNTLEEHPALVRPFPKSVTDVLDDKLLLARLLQGSGIAPECIASPDEASDGEIYFVKHRYGAQGKSVYAFDKVQLAQWAKRSRNAQDFCIQKEVLPALDDKGRKFVLRSHLLLVRRGKMPLQAYLHRDVICLPHASPFHSRQKSAHISQAGKGYPKPALLEDLEASHPAAHAFHQICTCSERLVELAADSLSAQPADNVTCFALLGNDFLVSDSQEIKLCEVNSHPALGWGTMAKVSSHVFDGLIRDTLDVVIFQHKANPGRYRPVYSALGGER